MSKTGLITGIPQTDNTVNFSVYAKNSVGYDNEHMFIIIYANGEVTNASITPEITIVERGSTKEFTISLEGYGDVEQVAYWSFYMWDNELGSAFPQPTDSELSVDSSTPSKTVTLTVGKNEEREQIRVVAYSKPGNNGVKTYATVIVVDEKINNQAKSVTFFDTASDGNPTCAINDITPYLVNGVSASTGTLGEDGCTAYIDSNNGILYLNNYNGGPIAVLDEYYNQLKIVLQGNNTITNSTDSTADRYGIYSKNGLIDISSASNGTLIINNDNDLLNIWNKENTDNHKHITYGIENESILNAKNINIKENGSSFEIEINNKIYTVEVPVAGKHFIYNSLAAIAVGLENNIEMEKIIEGISNFSLTKSRMEIIKNSNDIIIINDCYNASYESVKAALEYVSSLESNRKIAVLGDVLELGEFSKQMHQKMGEEVVNNNIDILITVGAEAKTIADTVKNKSKSIEVYSFNNNQDASNLLKQIMRENDAVLVKASNGMHFDEIVEYIK